LGLEYGYDGAVQLGFLYKATTKVQE